MLAEIRTELLQRYGIATVGGLGFENAYALAMRADRAAALGIRSLADLAAHARQLSIAGDYEFFARPEWNAVRKAYGLTFREQRPMQPGFMYQAAAAGEVDVISAYTSDALIETHGLAVLNDPRQAIPPYDAFILIAPKRAADGALLQALQPLAGTIDVVRMREANRRAIQAGQGASASPEQAARWLSDQIGAAR